MGLLIKLLTQLLARLKKNQKVPDLVDRLGIKENWRINTFDCDGVIQISKDLGGVHPGPWDVIITGRSYQESAETEAMLIKRGIRNRVYFNSLVFEDKTRESSGQHKANTIKELERQGYTIKCHFEDDPIQAKIIKEQCPKVNIIMLVHNLTELENVRHYDE